MIELDKVYCGGCLDVMNAMGSGSIDLTITSPPYDDLRTYRGYTFDFEAIAKELYRVTKPGGVMVWVVADATVNGSETGTSFRQALFLKECGFNLHDTMIYFKDNPVPVGGRNRYYQAFEYMFVLSKGAPATFNPIIVPRRNKWNDHRTTRWRAVSRGKDGGFEKKQVPIKTEVKKRNVWTYVVSGGSAATDKIASKHPAIFPEQLVNDHIVSWTNEGDVVFDPMCGSGTTLKMAIATDRKFLGVDCSEEYCEVCCQRLGLDSFDRSFMHSG